MGRQECVGACATLLAKVEKSRGGETHLVSKMEHTCETVFQATKNSLGKGLDVGVFDCFADLRPS